jgi:hypothetical protein
MESVKNKNQKETLKTKSSLSQIKKNENHTNRKNKWKIEFQEDKIDIKEENRRILTQKSERNIQGICDYLKRTNLQIFGIKEEEV